MSNYSDSPRYQIQYPLPSAAANVPGDLETPIDTIDSVIAGFYSGTASARPTAGTYAAPSASGTSGRFYYASDSGNLSMDTGSAWVAVGPINTVDATTSSSTPGATGTAGSSLFSAAADHVHPRESWGSSSDYKAPAAAAAAGSTGRVADAGHVHPMFLVGVPYPWIGASLPASTILLNGAVVSQSTYPLLWAICGTSWNTGGEGTGNFRLPNFVNYVPAGAGGAFAFASYNGANTITLTTGQMPNHTHVINDPGHYHTGVTGVESQAHQHAPGWGFYAGFSVNNSSSFHAVTNAAGYSSSPISQSENAQHTHAFSTNGAATGVSLQSSGNGMPVSVVQSTVGCYWITGAG